VGASVFLGVVEERGEDERDVTTGVGGGGAEADDGEAGIAKEAELSLDAI